MKTRMIGLASTALLLLAAPAVAGQSTRAEREATRQLNLEQSQQAQTQASAPPTTTADASANAPLNTPPAAAPTAHIQSASIANADGAAPATPAAPTTLSSIISPPVIIGSANVRDISGQIIGAVQRVEMTPQGMPTKVSVALIGANEKTVVLDAGKVTYDAASNEITSRASREQILSGQG